MNALETAKTTLGNDSLPAMPIINDMAPGNVIAFSSVLRELRQNVDPGLVRQREYHNDTYGNIRVIDYVEWHTVADVLDQTAPNWNHTVKDIRSIGDFVTVTVAISINGVTREGIGTGPAASEIGIKKAEHDALKRAAVKFGIGRDLYKRDSAAVERTQKPNDIEAFKETEKAFFPVAKSLSDLVTSKQLRMIRGIAEEKGIEAEAECRFLFNCSCEELSRKAASLLIDRLKGKLTRQTSVKKASLKKAG